MFQSFKYFTKICEESHSCFLERLLDFNVFFGVALMDKVCSDFVSVVALKDDFVVFCGSSAGAE